MATVVIITSEAEAAALSRWGYHFARGTDSKLFILYVVSGGTPGNTITISLKGELPTGTSDDKTLKAICQALRTLSSEAAKESEVEIEIKQLEQHNCMQAVLAQVEDFDTDLLIVGKQQSGGDERAEDKLALKLFGQTTCDTMLIRLGDSNGMNCQRILVPVAGGPHAKRALILAEHAVSESGGEVTALHVESDVGDVAHDVGLQIIHRLVEQLDFLDENRVKRKVVLSDDIKGAISQTAAEGYDLMILGASNVGAIRRALFGTVPGRFLTGSSGMAVAVIHRGRPLIERARARVEHWFDLAVPQLDREDRITLFKNLEAGSRWNFDFLALLSLSTAIATLGLIQNSTAVVIGAMLVAPLMTPLLGAGLALVQGNMLLIRNATRSIFFGFITAIAISVLIGFLVPVSRLTPELIARGGPTLLDMAVAFLSGVAAAYCIARPTLSAALPGVAIAAALVPPLAATGVCLAIEENENAQGAAILFGTNVVAIILGAALSLYAGGIRGPKGQHHLRLWTRFTFLGLMLMLAVLAVPLASVLLSQISEHRQSSVMLPALLRGQIAEEIYRAVGGKLVSVNNVIEEDLRLLEIHITSPTVPTRKLASQLRLLVKKALKKPVKIRLITKLSLEVERTNDVAPPPGKLR